MAERTKATVLKTVVLRTPVNESLGLKEALSFEGAFLVSEAPPSGRHRGWVPVTVGVWLTRAVRALTSASQGLSMNIGRWSFLE